MGIDDKFDEASGRAKQAAGDLTDNDKLKAEGQGDEAKGRLKGFADKAADKFDDVVDGDN